jgi:hypothetical protein
MKEVNAALKIPSKDECHESMKSKIIGAIETIFKDEKENIPAAGFNANKDESSERHRERMVVVVNKFLRAVCGALSVDHDDGLNLYSYFLEHKGKITINKQLVDMKYTITSLVHSNCSEVSQVALACMCTAWPRQICNEILRDYAPLDREDCNQYNEDNSSKCKTLYIGNKRFTTARKNYDKYKDGQLKVRKEYKVRAPLGSVAEGVSFMLSKLQPVPGETRKLKLDGVVYKDLPALVRNMSIKKLFKIYKTSVTSKDKLGKYTFRKIVKLLTIRSKPKAGLSSYYCDLKHCVSFVEDLLKKVKIHLKQGISNLKSTIVDGNTIQSNIANKLNQLQGLLSDDARKVRDELDFINNHLLFKYSSHLKLNDTDSVHCCTHGLGSKEKCSHSHTTEVCLDCYRCVSFCEKYFVPYLSLVARILPSVKVDIENMLQCSPIISRHIENYMAHLMRAFVQFKAISKLKKELPLDGSVMYGVGDHKSRTLAMEAEEQQVWIILYIP